MPYLVDVHEPDDIYGWISQSIPGVTRWHAPGEEVADYYWFGVKNTTWQVERKHVTEICADIDGVEDQLDREREGADNTYLLIEDFLLPTSNRSTAYSLHWATRRKGSSAGQVYPTFRPGFKFAGNMFLRMESWLWRVDRAGISVVRSASPSQTATLLTMMWKNSQEENHSIFERYVRKQKPRLRFNPEVDFLTRIDGVGPETAKLLVNTYENRWAAMNAGARDLRLLLGPSRAQQFLKGIGRSE